MGRSPVEGERLTLRDVLPQAGEPYPAAVEKVWRDADGRLWARCQGDGGAPGRVFEVWLRQEPWQ